MARRRLLTTQVFERLLNVTVPDNDRLVVLENAHDEGYVAESVTREVYY
jgi:hypothetical protein